MERWYWSMNVLRSALSGAGSISQTDNAASMAASNRPERSQRSACQRRILRVNGGAAHSLNANRIGALIPKPHEVEHWTFVNGGGGWDHPIHLHFEEGVTIDRGTAPIPDTERLVRKDVWRLGAGGRVKFQVRFGEFGGAYVNHCHNTVHEDFAMLLRYQLLTPPPGSPDFAGLPHWIPTQTPRPTPEGIRWDNPEVEILPEGDPRTSG